MSEGKRVSLQSIGPAKKDKKCKSTSTTIRLNLTLPTCNSANFADFNYNTLLLNEKRKKLKGKEKDDKVNGTATLDPYASDDEDDLRQIARSFESKYGTPKKKCSRLEDFTELGTGYDENDSFIDNTDAYDEVVPEDQTPEFDGFYINKGQLVLKRVDGRSSSDSSDEEDEGPQNSKSHKRQLSSESDSSNSDSSDDSDDSDESEESEEDEKNEEDVEMIDSPNEVNNGVKEDKSNGHITSPVAKKPKLSEVPSKKAKNKAITGLFLKKAVSEKEHNEKRLKLDLSDNEDNEKRLKQVSKDKEPNEKRVKLESEEMKHISHIDAAIEAVARGDDSKESGIAESKSHSGSSDESDAEEPKNAKLNGHSNNRRSNPPPLPADLPRSILNVIGALKEIANKNKNLGKQQFFNNEINKALLSFVKLMRTVPREKKGGVYDHLLFFLPCGKETLLKRGKALLAENVEAGYQEPLAQLKSGIDIAMPRAMERYRSMSIKYESDLTDHSKISPEKAKVPRRRFPWTEELRNLLCLAVKKRRIYYGTMKQKGERWDDHLREFLKKDVVTMWQTGWMKVGSLMEVIAKVDSDLLQFKLISPGIKKEALPGSSKKALIKNRYSTDDTVKYDAPAKRASSACSSSSSKPLLNITHQSLNNSVSIESSEAIAKKMQPLRNEGTAASSMTVAQPNIPTSASQSSSFDNYIDKEIVECIRTSLASNNVVSVTPVASPVFSVKLNNQKDNVSLECGSNTHNVPSSTALKSISNSVDIINLQANGLDATVESHPRKRPSFPSGNINPNGVHTFSAEDLSKPQTSSSLPTGTHCQPPHISSPHSSIKVSSVSAINLKLTASQPQQQAFQGQATSSKSAQSQPLKTNQQQTVSVSCNSSHQAVPLYNSHSVISHGLESSSLGSNASLTITPVKPTLSSSTYYQQTKASGHSSAPISSSQTVSYGSSSLRSEVIVTPSCNSGMPHIKSTNLNYSVSSTSSVSNSNNFSSPSMSGNNFSALPSNSGNNYSNSRNSSSINYLSSPGVSNNSFPLPNPEASVRTNRLLGNVNETQASKSPSDKASFAQPIRNSFPDKTLYMSPNMWQSSVPMDIQRSSSSSPSSLKSVTPSPEKAMVSRKDRILQDTRERTNSDPTMPTLSGPYQSANAMNEQSSVMRNQSQHQAKATPQSSWDDELLIIEDYLKTSSQSSTLPQSTHKVLIASTESYKLTLPVLEPQRCDNVLSKSSPDLIRSKNSMGSTSSESQRVNVVMHTPLSHHSQKSNSVGYPQQSRDQTRSNTAMSNHAIHDVQRSNSSKMSSISDAQRANVVMPTPQLQESLRANSLKDEMSDILAGIPTQMISRTDHYTITNSMPGINTKKKASPGGSDLDIDITIGSSLPVASRVESKSVGKLPEDSLLTAQDLAMRGIVMSRANCDGSYVEETWSSQMKKNSSNKSSSDTPDQRLSGMGTLSSSLSMTGLDGMGLGLPSHLVGYQNDYQRHLYGGSSKSSGSNDHRPS